MTSPRLRQFAWLTLAVTVVVILWGAYVRASGSGAGCGSHWPTCDGEVLPRPKTAEMLVEFLHRASSGVIMIMVLVELVWTRIALPRAHPARGAAAASMILMCTEAALGAGLVLFQLVAHDKSAARAVSMALHSVNTLFLLAAITATAHFASGGAAPRLRSTGLAGRLLAGGALGLVVVASFGAITALGDTLFTAPSLARGIADDLSPAAHFLQQLRVLHPIAAVLVSTYLLYARGPIAARGGATTRRLSTALAVLVVGQLGLGVLNFALMAPVAMQMIHLPVGDLVWVTFVLFGISALAEPAGEPPIPTPAAARDLAGWPPRP